MSNTGLPVIVAAVRTPIGTAGASLRSVTAADLAAPVLRRLAGRRLGAEAPDDVVLGNCMGPGGDVARVAALAAGLARRRPGADRGPAVRQRAGGGRPWPPRLVRGEPGVRPGRRRRVRVDRAVAVLAAGGRRRAASATRARRSPRRARRPGHGGRRRRPAGRGGRRQPRAAGRVRRPLARRAPRPPRTRGGFDAETGPGRRRLGGRAAPRRADGRAAGPAAAGLRPGRHGDRGQLVRGQRRRRGGGRGRRGDVLRARRPGAAGPGHGDRRGRPERGPGSGSCRPCGSRSTAPG